ncbi:hypothetical protein D3C75_1036700 [compost metagenome]
MHFFAGKLVACQCGFLQPLEYQLNGFDCQTIGVVTSHYRYISFDCMCQYVHTGISNSSSRQAVYKLWIDDRNIWSQLVVSQRILSIVSSCLVGNYRERSYF